ncbi:MAG TPA: ABC transporter substrate-binding protein [Solirubrobacteraceae bacterium]|nr:ABC transporter substrate-binding protein [Solirubrobacteraceae bacterium]
MLAIVGAAKEALIAESPDVVISAADIPPEDLKAAGIELLVPPGRCVDRGTQDFDEIFAAIEHYGRILGTEDAARASVEDLRKRVEAVTEQAGKNPSGRTAAALIFSTEGPLGAYGRLGTVHDQIGALRLTNVFASQNKAYYEVNTEALLDSDPDVLILLGQKIGETAAELKRALVSRKELRKLKAIRHDDIVIVHYGETSGAPVAVGGLEKLAKQLAALR